MYDSKPRSKQYRNKHHRFQSNQEMTNFNEENVVPNSRALKKKRGGIHQRQESDLVFRRKMNNYSDGYQDQYNRKEQSRNDGNIHPMAYNAEIATSSKLKPIVKEVDHQNYVMANTKDISIKESRNDFNTIPRTPNTQSMSESCGNGAGNGTDSRNSVVRDLSRLDIKDTSVSSSHSEAADNCNAVILAPKKPPAIRNNLPKVNLLTNFWELQVRSKIVYRYDVAIYVGTPTDQKAVNLLRGDRDDASFIHRRKLCLRLLHYALEWYRILSAGSALAYDGASMMFSSEDLAYALKEHSGVLWFDVNDLPEAIRKLIFRVDAKSVTIEISPCSAASFDMADLSAQKNRNWATIDRSLRQFYELITNQDAVLSGRFTQFGVGCLFYSKPSSENVGYGFQSFYGARKGIKFVEGRRRNHDDILTALVLDHRVGVFFNSQNLMRSICEFDGMENVQHFDFSSIGGRMNNTWTLVHQYVKGVRMNYMGTGTNPISFIASGISNKPIKELKDKLPNSAKTEVSVLAKFAHTKVSINPNWPAVMLRVRGNVQYFPMELLEVAPNQRVPPEKQLIAKRRLMADNPYNRFNKIRNLLEALNLHDNGMKNEFLRAFGITVSSSPMRVEGFRRQAPGIFYSGERPCKIESSTYAWNQDWDSKYIKGGSVDHIIIVHSDNTGKLPRKVIDALENMFKCRGIHCGRFTPVVIKSHRTIEGETQLEQIFKDNASSKETILIIYIDPSRSKSHDFLKLLERKYLIPTQQITAELADQLPRKRNSCANFVLKTNLKLGGVNYEVVPESFAKDRWISSGKTLIVGYDVAHPGKPTKDEVMNRMPPQKPSVVGISFNGAVHPESFIGDYHFQTPYQEKVDSVVLNARFKWILNMFTKNRRVWPHSIVITRDGVSEGQYKMVVDEELYAIKEACYEFGALHGRESWVPKFTVIVATKRHNARFVVDGGRIENPKPATVVDTDVVRNNITEFYMQSHTPLLGTAKSTAYQVMIDENNMSMDELQSMMLALTFHHQVSQLPVSLPEPVYQADEWAKRGKNIWNAYSSRHNFILKHDRGRYADFPIDFEGMTNRLAFWNTKLEDRRVNA